MLPVAYETFAPLPAPLQQQVWTLMSGLIHDLRQPLSVIDACADYLNLVLPAADAGAREQLELLQQQVGDANRILHEAILKLHYDADTATGSTAASLPLTNAARAGVTY